MVGWGADGVIISSVMVKVLAEEKKFEQGLKEPEIYASLQFRKKLLIQQDWYSSYVRNLMLSVFHS